MKGFILTRHWRDTAQGVQLELWLSTDSGAILLSIPRQFAVCFARTEDIPALSSFSSITTKTVGLYNTHHEPVSAVYCRTQRQLRELVEQADKRGIIVWESDIKPVERFLMERFITASLTYYPDARNPVKKQQQSSAGYQTMTTTRVKPCNYQPQLRVVSLDIETSMDARQLYSIAVYTQEQSHVFMVSQSQSAQHNVSLEDGAEIVWSSSAKQCLQQFLQWIQLFDPDVIIGWHVVQFDLWVLQQLCDRWRLPFTIGRQQQPLHWRDDSQNPGRHYVQIPGRVILDGIELLRTAFYHFESFSLQAVAAELLGESKLLTDDDRGQAITELYQTDPQALARYNLQDCKLVWRIFEVTRLLDFAIERSCLTGLALDRLGGSVASFEYAYLPRLHRAGYVAPNLGELESDVISPGGYILNSRPGIYRNVLVLDFKSLYPSIIRTFMIDPCAFWVAQHQQLPSDQTVPGFNGARFSRENAILPTVIEDLWQARDRAKADKNQPLSQAIKIIMNSFYGVLGSPGCRFFDPRVCSSITLRGHEIIQRSRDWLQQQGHDVIYGDTDSLFVWLGDEISTEQASKTGNLLAAGLNQWWQETLHTEFVLDSALEIEFETCYQHFLMPTIRGSSEGSKKRYAGIIRHGDEEKLIFKGLETVRTDWTSLAKQFQQVLYHKIFKQELYQDYINHTVNQLLIGNLDDLLIYRKKLRRPLQGYQKSTPPHVKAARLLSKEAGKTLTKGDSIDYVVTVNGPEPTAIRRSAIHYQHYIDKQLKPIANSILVFVDDDFESIINRQLVLI